MFNGVRLRVGLGPRIRNKHLERKSRAKLTRELKEAVSPLEVWAMNFVHEIFAAVRKYRILMVTDT